MNIAIRKKSIVSLYLYGEDQLYIKALLDDFGNKTRYNVTSFTSWVKLVDNIPMKPLSKKGIHIVLLAFNFDKEAEVGGKTGYEVLHELKLLSHDLEVILISKGDEEQLKTFVESLPGVTLIKKNENSFLRIHNNIKRIRSHIFLEKKKKLFKIWRFIFFTALAIVLIGVLSIFLYDPSILLS